MESIIDQKENPSSFKYENLIILLITISSLGIAYIFKLLRRDPNQVKLADQLPGPKGIPVIGNALDFINLKEDEWKEQRKLQSPYYSNTYVKSLIPKINDYIYQFLPIFDALVGESEFDICDYVNCWSFNHHSRVRLNIDEEFSLQEVKQYFKTRPYSDISSYIYGLSNITKYISFLFGKNQDKISQKDAVYSLIKRIINNKLPHLQAEIKSSDINGSKRSFASAIYMFEKDQKLKNCLYHNVKDVLKTFSNNLAHTTASFLFLVAAHPEIQDKLQKELDEVFGNKNQPATDEDIARLPYLNQVMMESLRWHTLSATTMRNVDEPIQIGSYLLPVNTILVIDFYNLHRDPENYPNPEKFDPDRFLPENIAARPKCSFLPFTDGPRGCVGKNFAITSMKLMVVALLRTYRFHTTQKPENIKFSGDFLRHSLEGFKVSITLRNEGQKGPN